MALSLKWDIQTHDFKIINVDTDSCFFAKRDGKPFSDEEADNLLSEINSLMPELTKLAFDGKDKGRYRRVIVVKAKNYILQDMKKNIKIKGSGLKATMKEKALQQYIKEVIDLLLVGHKDQIYPHYMGYVQEIKNIKDISRWCSKKTMTKSVMNPERTQEVRINEAASNEDIREGDKFYVFFKSKDEIALEKDFDGTYDKSILFKKLYNTAQIFESVFDTEMLPNYSLKRYESDVF